MLNGFIIMLREGLEAALIVGILLAYLHHIEQRQYSRYVWLGVGAAVGASLVTALVFSLLAGSL